MPSGAFITIEGGDGAGKSTQAALLADALEARGHRVVRVHEPGGTALGERVRGVLLDAGLGDVDATAELMLYEAARAQLVSEVVAPALEDGAVVVCDRFADSSIAYQGYGRGLGADVVRSLNAVATGGLSPDCTVLLDMPSEEGMDRAISRSGSADRMEAAGEKFHRQVRDAFRELAATDGARWRTVDARGTREEVAARVLMAVDDVLGDRAYGESGGTAYGESGTAYGESGAAYDEYGADEQNGISATSFGGAASREEPAGREGAAS